MKKMLGIGLSVIGIVTVIVVVILKLKRQMSISIIGGADGPTSVFIAGKVGNTSAVAGVLVGIVLLVIGVFMIRKKR
ncbi:MAG: LPXTG cell wall anchor domain-containing protein [Lachnospiraceae bacterium]|nr:LPXTG cell wall anchor domain-containing protein [Lachnospiraceae bacterium]